MTINFAKSFLTVIREVTNLDLLAVDELQNGPVDTCQSLNWGCGIPISEERHVAPSSGKDSQTIGGEKS